MDPRVASLAAIVRLNGRLFHHCLAGLSDEAAQERPGPQVNNIAFVAAHLVDSRHYLLALLGDQRPNPLPAPEGGFNDITKVTRYPTLAEMRAAWDAAGQALEARLGAATATQLDAPEGEGWPIEEHTRYGVLTFMVQHESHHVGQLGLLRKVAGLPAMAYA